MNSIFHMNRDFDHDSTGICFKYEVRVMLGSIYDE